MHDLHIWSLNAEKISLSCHLVTEFPSIAMSKATSMLKDQFDIYHVTIQTESLSESLANKCKTEAH